MAGPLQRGVHLEEPVAGLPLPELGVLVHSPKEAPSGRSYIELFRDFAPHARFGLLLRVQRASEERPLARVRDAGDVIPELQDIEAVHPDDGVGKLFGIVSLVHEASVVIRRAPRTD